jgi:tol-pal system protein YbgF
MKRTGAYAAAVLAALIVSPPAASAANKEQQQLMAEIRMLQEQQQQLQQMLGGLADTLKTMTAKLDEQTSSSRKSFADQKLLVDNVGEGVRILREKADDTNVRLASLTQELEAMRQTIAAHQTPVSVAPAPGVDPTAPVDPSAPPSVTVPTPGAGAATAPPPNVSHQKMYDTSYADYAAGQWELAVAGFESYIRMFGRSPLADDAQLNIGNSYYNAGKFQEAVDAFQKVVRDYPQSDSVPAAWYKLGLSYDRLNQPELARKAFDTVMKEFPSTSEAVLAKQRLDSLNRPR